MYSKDGKMFDRRELLKVKVLSLSDEARTIRRMEQKSRGILQSELHEHRVRALRFAARDAHIAYGFCKGRTWKQMEPTAKSEPNWKAIIVMLEKYGPIKLDYGHWFNGTAMKKDQATAYCISLGMPSPEELKKAA